MAVQVVVKEFITYVSVVVAAQLQEIHHYLQS